LHNKLAIASVMLCLSFTTALLFYISDFEKHTLNKPQYVQSSEARILTWTDTRDHTTILKSLH